MSFVSKGYEPCEGFRSLTEMSQMMERSCPICLVMKDFALKEMANILWLVCHCTQWHLDSPVLKQESSYY